VPLYRTFDALVLTPSRIFFQNPAFYVQPPLLKIAVPWAICGLACGMWAVMTKPTPGSTLWQCLMAGKLVFIASVVAISLFRNLELLTLATPFTWLILFSPDQEDCQSQEFSRSWLCILTVLQTLYAYPVAGSQSNLIQILLLITFAVCVGDSWVWLVNLSRLRLSGNGLTVGGLCLISLLYVEMSTVTIRRYLVLPALDLPGARRIHLTANDKSRFEWLARNLRQHCDAFEGLPGLPSLNFWSGLYPLTGWNSDAWTFCLTSWQQDIVVDALATHARACIVENSGLARFWGLRNDSTALLPLVQYIRSNFQTVGSIDGYNLMMRRDRDIARVVLR